MKRFVEGADRGQSTLLPECLDEWVEESNSARVIDCFVDSLDLADLGFEGVEPAAQLPHVCCLVQSGRQLLEMSISHFDPSATLARISCCSCEADFSSIRRPIGTVTMGLS
jgi:hypothetical protein